MIVGVPKEIKVQEHRVGLTPSSVRELIVHGHRVLVQSSAGAGIGFDDETYRRAGAEVVTSAQEVFEGAEMIVKVKEPQPQETALLSQGQVLFAYLHLAADPRQTQALMDCGCMAIAYETVTDSRGGLPLLAPMSEVAGRMSVQVGARCLEKSAGGGGMLLGGVPGVPSAKVVILGCGVAGGSALRMATGLEAQVTVIDRSLGRLAQLDEQYGGRIQTLYSTTHNLEESVLEADLVIGAVLIPGAAAPKLVTREMIAAMRPGSAVVDIAVDQGGCLATTHPTTHDAPTYRVDGVVHYAVANMPGGVARTATMALNNATLPFTLTLADKGAWQAMADDPHLARGMNVCRGQVTHQAVARDLGLGYTPAERFLKG